MTPRGPIRRAHDGPRRPGAPAPTVDWTVSGDADVLPELDIVRDIVAAFNPPPGLVERIEPQILRSLRSSRAQATRRRWFQMSPRMVGASFRHSNRSLVPRLPTSPHAARAAAGVLGLLILSAGVGQAVYAASGAGQPLYGIRVSIERAMLPAVDADGRVSAQLVMLGRRLDEAEDAADRRDMNALSAAIGSYRSDLEDLRIALGHRPDRSAAAVTGLRTDLERLHELVSRSQTGVAVWETIREVHETLRLIFAQRTSRASFAPGIDDGGAEIPARARNLHEPGEQLIR